MAKTLTFLTIQNRKRPTKRLEIADGGAAGLFLVHQPSNRRSWTLRYRDATGRSVKLKLGDYLAIDDEALKKAHGEGEPLPPKIGEPLTIGRARALAGALNLERAQGVDLRQKYVYSGVTTGTEQEKGAKGTFTAVATKFFREYRTKHRERPRRWHGDARILGLEWPRDCIDPSKVEPKIIPQSLADLWQHKPVRVLTTHDIRRVVNDARVDGIPGLKVYNDDISENRARKVFAALSVLCTWLLERPSADEGHISVDPTASVKAPKPPVKRKRKLDERELRWFWLATGRLSVPYGLCLRTLLLTASRLNETVGMSRSELSADGSLWTIPPSRTKNHEEHKLWLPPLTRETIAAAPKIAGPSGAVFSISGGPLLTNWSHVKKLLDAKMLEIARAECGTDVAIPHFTLHDLRRTAATTLQRLGVPLEHIELTLNHKSGSFAGIVDTYQTDPLEDDVRDALNRLSRFVPMVADVKLHAAHEKFMKGDDDDNKRRAARQTFHEAIKGGGDRWQGYLNMLAGKEQPKVTNLAAQRNRRGKE